LQSKKSPLTAGFSHVVFVRDCGDAHIAQSFCFLNPRAVWESAPSSIDEPAHLIMQVDGEQTKRWPGADEKQQMSSAPQAC
jgi:hypothetical protein